jgi:hypothetical protein
MVFLAQGEQCLALAVSDGAGSATHSHIGSQIAVQTALSSLAKLVEEEGEVTEDSNGARAQLQSDAAEA